MSKKQLAAFTIVQNEDFFLDIWVNYYSKTIPKEDLYILNHNSATKSSLESLDRHRKSGVNIIPVHRFFSFDHGWLRDTVQFFQSFLLQSYDVVAFAESDEILVPNPELHPYGLKEYVVRRFAEKDLSSLKCVGYSLEHDPAKEPCIDLSKPVFNQRKFWRYDTIYNKTLISKVPCKWVYGVHLLEGSVQPKVSYDLFLVHLHKLDYELCKNKHREQVSRIWNAVDLANGFGFHNRFFDGVEFDKWFFNGNPGPTDPSLRPVPSYMSNVI